MVNNPSLIVEYDALPFLNIVSHHLQSSVKYEYVKNTGLQQAHKAKHNTGDLWCILVLGSVIIS